MELKNNDLTQSYLSKHLGISLSVVNLALKPIRGINAIKVKQRSFSVIDKRKMLFYWASVRNLQKDILYSTRIDKDVKRIESEMPSNVEYAAYSAFKFMFKDLPADYSEIYVYSKDTEEIKKRFPENKNSPNLVVLRKDENMEKMTLANLFVDLWNLKEWYAKDFLKAMEEKINGLLE